MGKNVQHMIVATKPREQQLQHLDRYFLYAPDKWDFLHRILRSFVEKYEAGWQERSELKISKEEFSKLDPSTMITVRRVLADMGIHAKEVATATTQGTYQILVLF